MKPRLGSRRRIGRGRHQRYLACAWSGPRLVLACALAGLVLAAAATPARAVVINEIHYHPPEGKELEFVEIHNPSPGAVSLGGWEFTDGIEYVFPSGAVLGARAYAVVCRDPSAMALSFGLRAESLRAWSSGSGLDRGGETVTLVDSRGALVDSVRYDDAAPWDGSADGDGPSLQRLCAEADSNLATNWTAFRTSPTPLAPNAVSTCPPPAIPPPTIAVNEIHYHPLSNRDDEEEYVELVNASDEPVDLRGYCFAEGISFCFVESRILAPGDHLVVARNLESLRRIHGLDSSAAVGDFTGELANGGERLTLVDNFGRIADSVRYGDSREWSPAADGLGFSLEKITPGAPSDDPASWMDSGEVEPTENPGWREATGAGVGTGDALYFYTDAASEFLIDDVTLVNIDEPGVNLISNGTFDAGIEGWQALGTHSGSRWSRAPGGTLYPEAALHLVATDRGSGSSSSVQTPTTVPLDRSGATIYRLTFKYLHLSGSPVLTARVEIATPSRGAYVQLGSQGKPVSPGRRNFAWSPALPPFVSHLGRYPREPRSSDTTWIHAKVRGGATSVTLTANLNSGVREFPMLDDGLSRDGAAGDGVHGAGIPPQPHGTAVTFTIEATSPDGARGFPAKEDPLEHHGYYVNDNRPASKLPIYTLIVPSSNPRNFVAGLNCETYVDVSFAASGDLYSHTGLRRRGGSVCGDPNIVKKYLKVKFPRGHEFQGVRKLNFQSLYTDKSLIREHMAWELFGSMGNPYCTHEYVRLHANGSYFGLYAAMEHPDENFLERNGLDPEGNLYKATASREEATGTYEKETNEDGDFTDLRAFLNQMHATPSAGLTGFFQSHVDEDNVIEYQASQVLTNNSDYPHKNHFLYHDPGTSKWMVITWDVDLTFGKVWNGTYKGVLNDGMHSPGISPWYTTNVRGEGTGNYLLDKFFSQSGTWYRRAYVVRLWDALHEKYVPELYDQKIEALHELLFDEQLEDIARWGRSSPSANDPTAPAEFEPNLERVRQHISVRREYLINYLQTKEKFTGHDRMKITEIMYNPPGDDGLEFLELWNSSGREIDISGWSMKGLGASTSQGGAGEFVFPGGTTVSSGEVIIVAKDPDAFSRNHGAVGSRLFGPFAGRLGNDGETLRLRDAGPGFPATVDFVRYGTEGEWPSSPDGVGYSLELSGVHPDLDNDLAVHWRASELKGGSPGYVNLQGQAATYFQRGNCNLDTSVDLADALAILFYLFAGGAEPPCLDGCDINGNQAIAVDDAVALLRFLFQPGSFSIPSPSPYECIPTASESCARSNCIPR